MVVLDNFTSDENTNKTEVHDNENVSMFQYTHLQLLNSLLAL